MLICCAEKNHTQGAKPPVKIYHNPKCSKSRQTLALIEAAGIEPEIVLYLQSPPSKSELAAVLKQLGIPARGLLRKGEDEYKSLNLADPGKSEAEIIAAMCSHPRLIERPIVVEGGRAVLGRPPENVQALL
ncbi:MAG: arsenate reductase (glutaredoxin) [Pseudomonadales bacterium]|nr:arsenate reductase (glutaredoxin) [Pseudomonadales bacterium]